MKNSGQNPVAVVILLLVIAIAIAFVIRVAIPKRSPPAILDWTCEACGHRFVDESQREPRVCSECGGEAVRTIYYYCSVHDHVFEAYRSKPDPDVDPKVRSGLGIGILYKVPGREWTKERPEDITCPQGNSGRNTLSTCPPGSEHRKP